MNTKQARAFTLIEMLGVLFIIGILMGILFPTITKVLTKGKIARAQAEIESLSVALRMYESDLGKYPPGTAQEADALHKYLGTARTSIPLNIVVGPYMEFKAKDLGPGNIYLDPWKQGYVYASKDSSPAATNNTNSVDIYSMGPDGKSDSAATREDDVKNW